MKIGDALRLKRGESETYLYDDRGHVMSVFLSGQDPIMLLLDIVGEWCKVLVYLHKQMSVVYIKQVDVVLQDFKH
jgi:hypothetical protein